MSVLSIFKIKVISRTSFSRFFLFWIWDVKTLRRCSFSQYIAAGDVLLLWLHGNFHDSYVSIGNGIKLFHFFVKRASFVIFISSAHAVLDSQCKNSNFLVRLELLVNDILRPVVLGTRMIDLLLKGVMTRKKKLNNKETTISWNMKITENKWPWTKKSHIKWFFFARSICPICQGAWQVLRICGAELLELDALTAAYWQVHHRPVWSRAVHSCHVRCWAWCCRLYSGVLVVHPVILFWI